MPFGPVLGPTAGHGRGPTGACGPPRALVRANEAEHRALAATLAQLEGLQEAIAEADLGIETLRFALADFAGRYEQAVAPERRALTRVQMLLGHVARWLHLLADDAWHWRPHDAQLAALERGRDHELRAWRKMQATDQVSQEGDHPDEVAAAPAQVGADGPSRDGDPPSSWHARRSSTDARLKQAFRTLARRFHPDMAEQDDERARRSRLMAHINALYGAGDLVRLEGLAEQASVAVLAEEQAANTEVPLAERLAEAQARLAWFAAVLRSLEQERAALEQSPTHALWHALEGGPAGNRFRPHVLRNLRADIAAETTARLADLPAAMRALEDAVHERNHRDPPPNLRERAKTDHGGRASQALLAQAERHNALSYVPFDAHVGQKLARLGLEDLARRRVAPRIAEWARRLEARAAGEPAFVRLILLTYVVQLASSGMPGLESFDELSERFAACSRRDKVPLTLAEALLHGDGLVEYAPRSQGDGPLVAQLLFRDPALAEVVPQALRNFTVRQLFAEMLRHLGETMRCPAAGCSRSVYAVPLFVIRGLDHVRASVCPRCGTILRSYVLAKGSDVQGVLNATYLDFGLVDEFTVAFAQASVGLQMLPQQRASWTIRDLREQLRYHLFGRNDVQLSARALRFDQNGETLADHTPLVDLPQRQVRLQLTPQANTTEAEVLTTLRYRLQTRFAPTQPSH